MKPSLVVLFLVLFSASLPCQSGNIINTLGAGGVFSVNSGGNLLSLGQSDGHLSTYHGLTPRSQRILGSA